MKNKTEARDEYLKNELSITIDKLQLYKKKSEFMQIACLPYGLWLVARLGWISLKLHDRGQL